MSGFYKTMRATIMILSVALLTGACFSASAGDRRIILKKIPVAKNILKDTGTANSPIPIVDDKPINPNAGDTSRSRGAVKAPEKKKPPRGR